MASPQDSTHTPVPFYPFSTANIYGTRPSSLYVTPLISGFLCEIAVTRREDHEVVCVGVAATSISYRETRIDEGERDLHAVYDHTSKT